MHNILENFQIVVNILLIWQSTKQNLAEKKNYWSKAISISALKIDYLGLENSVRNTERYSLSQSSCRHCGGPNPTKKILKTYKNYKGHKKPPFSSHNSSNKST